MCQTIELLDYWTVEPSLRTQAPPPLHANKLHVSQSDPSLMTIQDWDSRLKTMQEK